MAERIVQGWLNEYKSIGESEIPSFTKQLKNNIQLIKSIYDVLQQNHSNLQEPVCGQLYEFYRSGNFELKRFCLQFVPAVMWNYLYGLAVHKTCGRAESLLLGIYNMEAIEPDGISRVETFVVPTLAKPSVYHEPVSQLALTENVLSYQLSDHRIVTRGPMSQLKELTMQNRFVVLTHVLSEYNNDIGFLSPVSHAFFCQICSRLVLCGFTKLRQMATQSADDKPATLTQLSLDPAPRIQLDSLFMLEMLTGIYFVMFNGQATSGMQALKDLHFRASYESYANVLLVTNAIQHSLDTNPSGRPSDGPVGINVAVTPPSPVVKRSAITNASFKIRRQKETTIRVTIEGVEKTSPSPPPTSPDVPEPMNPSSTILIITSSTRQTSQQERENGGSGEISQEMRLETEDIELEDVTVEEPDASTRLLEEVKILPTPSSSLPADRFETKL